MSAALDRLPKGSRIAVIRLRSLGDCVLTAPALAVLKAYRPDLQIGVVVEDRFREIFEGQPDTDHILSPDQSLGRWKPRLVLNLHGGTRSMKMTALSLAPLRAGFAHHAYNFVYNVRIPRAQEILNEERPVHTAEHLASAMFFLGVPHVAIPRARLSFVDAQAPLPQRYAVIHPFASAPDKAWPIERFVAIARHLRDQEGAVVVVAGPSDDAGVFAEFTVLRNAPLNVVKQTMAGARVFVGNDSGPAHIAAAFGVPVVVLFGPSNSVTWAPWRTESRVLTAPRMADIEADAVLHAVSDLRVKV